MTNELRAIEIVRSTRRVKSLYFIFAAISYGAILLDSFFRVQDAGQSSFAATYPLFIVTAAFIWAVIFAFHLSYLANQK